MKFGLELQENIFPPWRLSYVSYDMLKQELKARQMDHKWTERDEREFIVLLDNELSKVYDFINAKLAEIDARILYCERSIQGFQNNPSNANYSMMDEALTDILFDVNDLSKFTRYNFTAIQKILKKHDRWTGKHLKQDYVQKLREKPLDKQRFDVSVVYISALLNICRNKGKQPTTVNRHESESSEEDTTTTYWVHPDNVTEVKSIIMLHLPVFVYNPAKKYEPSDSAVSSVYFDNPDFDLYTGLLQRDEMAEAIRLKWHGSCSSKNVLVERETFQTAGLNDASVKERCCINSDHVEAFLLGRYKPDDIANDLKRNNASESAMKEAHATAAAVQTSIQQKQLQPMLRVFNHHTLFQAPHSRNLKLTLDTDLAFIREDHLDGKQRRDPGDWRRADVDINSPFEYLSDKEILRFPYAVLEAKVYGNQKQPAWLTKLLEGHLVHEVPRFSKYLHGASHFYKERLALLPWWLAEMNADIRKPRAENLGLTRSLSFKPLIDGKYRRAMIEEREKASKQGAIIEEGVLEASELSSRPSAPFDKNGKSAAWLSMPSSNSKSDKTEEYTLIELNSSPINSASNLKTAVSQPLLPHEDDRNNNNNSSSSKGADVQRSRSFYKVAANGVMDSKGNLLSKKSLAETVDLESGEKKKVIKVKVDPKTFFANERTFIAWLQFCALLLTVALNLLNFGDSVSRIVGGVFIGVSGSVAIYALYRFEKRAWMISRKDPGRYDDLWGPAVLCVVLVIALIINLYLRLR
ncbi:SPX-domain-containing protein [Rhizopus microsporus ATCC 52813]|uniref:SPX-domain-containing protein n=3 Tax=Rhizopus microsporus TaxID=58291 RepID=A0A2G4T136_RHIZD|nr:SPX-domain-containing protein [Rhizopus microsporus ATCC 52813]PHZ14733.1 SPX-domain-containing protein [Rhizopus microsporus ATCC 52813]